MAAPVAPAPALRNKPKSVEAMDRFTKLLRDAVDSAMHDSMHFAVEASGGVGPDPRERRAQVRSSSGVCNDTGTNNEQRSTRETPPHNSFWAKLERQRKLAEINLLISKIHLLRLREYDLQTVFTLVEANLDRYRGDEHKASACELCLRALNQAADFMVNVADSLPTTVLESVKDIVLASAIVGAVDLRLRRVLASVKNLSRSLHADAALQERSQGMSRLVSGASKCTYWISSTDDQHEEKCSICLEELGVGNVLQSPPCKHVFHCHCLREWMKIRPSCPLCQRNLH